jgi:hypothetical protein
MPCPTCDHTLSRLTGEVGHGFYHCPRCGTVMEQAVDSDANQLPGFPKVYVPWLVLRCRQFEGSLAPDSAPGGGRDWCALGIAEAINTPQNRKD